MSNCTDCGSPLVRKEFFNGFEKRVYEEKEMSVAKADIEAGGSPDDVFIEVTCWCGDLVWAQVGNERTASHSDNYHASVGL